MTKPNSSDKNNGSYAVAEQTENSRYTEKYHLPYPVGNSQKQTAFAISMRNKFIRDFEKSENLPENVKSDIFNRIFKIESAKELLDFLVPFGKQHPFEGYLSSFQQQTTLEKPEERPVFVPTKTDIFLISLYEPKKVSVRTADDSLNDILSRIGMEQSSEFYWEKEIEKDNVDRNQFENNLIFTISRTGKAIKVENCDPNPKPEIHDATIVKTDGKLKVYCRTANTYNAFSRIGVREIDLTDTDSDEIKELIYKFDVGFADKETESEFL